MTYDPTPGHSGSRWEPVTASEVGHPADAGSNPGDGSETQQDRRRRWPLVAFLVTIVTLGTASAGVAWTRAQPADGLDPTSSTSGAPFAGGGPGRQRELGPDGPGAGTRPFGRRGSDGDRGPMGDQGSEGDQGGTAPGDQSPAAPGSAT